MREERIYDVLAAGLIRGNAIPSTYNPKLAYKTQIIPENNEKVL